MNLKERRKHLEHIRKNTLLTSIYGKLKNTVDFYERHQKYFVKHPYEFSRLVGQLETQHDREEFMHLIYTYYYLDVLHYQNEIEKEENKKNKEEEMKKVLPALLNTSLHINDAYINYTKDKKQSASGIKETNERIRTEIVTECYQILKKYKKELAADSHKGFQNMLLQLNSTETLMLESLMKHEQ
mmetsp:Transcript_5791/g.8517  ORF Transcript_5791/g.8517 Transcript_5791/m.8517 type:complete len:185 (+) Transcript_5791:95-649(+)